MHTVRELSCKTGDTYLGARWRRWRAVPLFVFLSFFLWFWMLALEKRKLTVMLVLLSVGSLFPCPPLCVPFLVLLCYSLSFSISLSLCMSWVALASVCSRGRGEGGATGVAASTGLEEEDDEGAVAGQNLLSPLYNLCLFSCPLFLFRLLLSLSLCFCIVFVFLVPYCSWLFFLPLSPSVLPFFLF